VPSPITLKKRLAAVELPTTPKGECDAALQKKVWRSRVAAACGLAPTATSQVQDFTEKKRRGLHFVDTLRAHKEFYNPSILETLVDQARSHSHANTKPNTNTNTSESYSRRHLPVVAVLIDHYANRQVILHGVLVLNSLMIVRLCFLGEANTTMIWTMWL
jgi:hypothetical protein